MAEKVIFEFRARRDEDGCGFEVRHGQGHFTVLGPDIGACCRPGGIPGGPRAGGARRSHRRSDKVRSHMRETLDFFERMYEDLFGEEESGGSGDPRSN